MAHVSLGCTDAFDVAMATIRRAAGALVDLVLVVGGVARCDVYPIVAASGFGVEAVTTVISAVGVNDPSIVSGRLSLVPENGTAVQSGPGDVLPTSYDMQLIDLVTPDDRTYEV